MGADRCEALAPHASAGGASRRPREARLAAGLAARAFPGEHSLPRAGGLRSGRAYPCSLELRPRYPRRPPPKLFAASRFRVAKEKTQREARPAEISPIVSAAEGRDMWRRIIAASARPTISAR